MRWLLLFTVGCYRPTPQAGAPCGPGDTCPSGLTCEGGFCGGGFTGDGSTDFDAANDSPVIPPDACRNFATQVDACTLSPGGPIVLTSPHTYDTDTHELRDANNVLVPTTSVMIAGLAGPIDAIVTTSFSLNANSLRVVGDVPFGVISFGNIVITGTLDANGGGGGGAGRRGFVLCPDGVGRSGTTDADGSSGAGGGSFRGKGAAGGEGDENQVPVAPGVGGNVTSLPLGPLGGCRGGTGGGGTDIGGPPGQGGGAVYLAALGSITIGGTIDVGGGGGEHGHTPSGAGGGGGSGGMIVLEASMVQIAGALAANGGGGGGGADDVAGGDGSDGAGGRLDTTRASGGEGAGAAEGGKGGEGGALANRDGSTSTEAADNGGGGGGGGAGFIAIGSPDINVSGVVSPALSPWPTP